MEDVNARQQFSIFFFLNLDTGLKNQLQKNSPTLDKLNEKEWELWSSGQSEFNFQVTFSFRLLFLFWVKIDDDKPFVPFKSELTRRGEEKEEKWIKFEISSGFIVIPSAIVLPLKDVNLTKFIF